MKGDYQLMDENEVNIRLEKVELLLTNHYTEVMVKQAEIASKVKVMTIGVEILAACFMATTATLIALICHLW